VKEFYIKLVVSAVVIGGLFAFAWKQGLIARLSAYFGETQEELRKCSWPTRDELVQSAVLIFVVVGGLGVLTIVSDYAILKLVRTMVATH